MVQQANLTPVVCQHCQLPPMEETSHQPEMFAQRTSIDSEKMQLEIEGLKSQITLLTQLIEQQQQLNASLIQQQKNREPLSKEGITVVVNTDKAKEKEESSSYVSTLVKTVAVTAAVYVAGEYVLPALISSVMQSGVPSAEDVASGFYLPAPEVPIAEQAAKFATGAATFVFEAASKTAEGTQTVFSELSNRKGVGTQAYEAIINSVSDSTAQLLIDSGETVLKKADSLRSQAFWFAAKGIGSLYTLKKTPSIMQGAFRLGVNLFAPGAARKVGI